MAIFSASAAALFSFALGINYVILFLVLSTCGARVIGVGAVVAGGVRRNTARVRKAVNGCRCQCKYKYISLYFYVLICDMWPRACCNMSNRENVVERGGGKVHSACLR